MVDGEIRIDREGDVAIFRADRPPVNAINLPFLRRIDQAFRELLPQVGVRAVIVTGREGSFCAGLDLKAVPTYGLDEQREMILTITRVIEAIYGARLPVVAAVNGHAIAGGLCLALACDYRVGPTADAQFGLTEARAGIPFPFGPMTVVEAELSPAVARRLALLAKNCGPEEALALGILDEVQPVERVLSRAFEVARELASFPGNTYGRIKRQLRARPLARIREMVDRGTDPLLDSWLAFGAAEASAQLLRH
jgi:enoyl-CoA hydratase